MNHLPFYRSTHMLRLLIVCGVTFFLYSCSTDPNADIEGIEIEVSFQRTDQAMHACAQYLASHPDAAPMEVYNRFLLTEGPFFYEMLGVEQQLRGELLEGLARDTLLANNLIPLLSDSIMGVILDTIQQVFPEDFPFKERLTPPLKRLKKHFPEIELPQFRTHANGFLASGTVNSVDQVIPLPQYFSFGLHYFLGRGFPYPPNIPQYIRNRFSSDFLEVHMAREIATGMVQPLPRDRQPKLIEKMVHEGIKQYFIKALLPNEPDSLLFFYTPRQMEWASLYEQNIYKDLLPNLYSEDFTMHRDYLTDKPYTTHLSIESAPRIGVYMGTKVVESYMKKNPDIDLAQLCETTDYLGIFKAAKYKP